MNDEHEAVRYHPKRAPQAWLDAIARGEADIAAGRTVEFDAAMRAFYAEDATEERARAGDTRAPD